MLKKHEPIKIIYVRMVKEVVESEEEFKGKDDWYENNWWIYENAI